MSSVSVSVSREFLAEMTKVVGSFGEVLIFDGTNEAINYLKEQDCVIFEEEAEVYDFITDDEDRVEKMKDVLRTHDNCRIIDEGDECLVFEDMDEARQEVAENSEVGDVFSASAIEGWVAENSSIEDVFDEDAILEHIGCCYTINDIYRDDEIKTAYKKIREEERKKMPEGELKKEKTLLGGGKFMTLLTPEQVQEQKTLVETLKQENETLKAKVAEMERTVLQAKQVKNLITQLIMPSPHEQERNPRDPVKRPGFDGFVWTWNADAGRGEWC
jgi:hypothetical protein